MRTNQRWPLVVLPTLLLMSWYAYARTSKEKDRLTPVPPPTRSKIANLGNLIDQF